MPDKSLYIVLWDDNHGLCAPMAHSAECEGALEYFRGDQPVALFANRKSARAAISISTAYAKLCRVQGKSANTDFESPGNRNLRIVEAKPYGK